MTHGPFAERHRTAGRVADGRVFRIVIIVGVLCLILAEVVK